MRRNQSANGPFPAVLMFASTGAGFVDNFVAWITEFPNVEQLEAKGRDLR